MRRELRKRIVLASVALAAIVAGAFATLLVTVHTLRTEGRLARHSEEVIATANELEREVLDLETGERGFVVTGDVRFLEPYRAARRSYPRSSAKLMALVSDNDTQHASAQHIDAAIREYERGWAIPLVRAAATSRQRARALVATAQGKRRVDALRARFAVFLARERILSGERNREFDRQAAYALVLGGVGLVGSLLLIGAFALFLTRRIVTPLRRVVLATQLLAGGDLEHRVPVLGDDEIGELGRGFNAMAGSLGRNRRELQEQNVDLERLADNLRAVLDATIDGILLTNGEGEIQLANRPLVKITRDIGMPMAGTASENLLSISDRVTDPDLYRATMERLRDNPDEASFDEFELADSGRVFQGFTGPVRAESGEFVGRVWTLREVTRERELDRMREDFVATVSHELRTPLTSMMGFLEMIREGEAGELTPEQDRFLAIVYRSSERLQRLVGDLLFVARLDASGLQLRMGETRVEEVVAECVEAVSALARSRGIDLQLESESVPALRGDAERLGQLVSNLLSNALKFTSSGGTVTARAFVEGEYAVVEVEDTGIGIPAEEMSRVFGRFFRSSTATEQAIPGTGLGLVISQAIAEGHGGRITVRSEAGRGTCFRVELPLAPARAPA